MQKNIASQKWIVFAFNRTDNTPVTSDSGNITANLRIDGGAANPVDDVNPTELEDGYYVFDITQTETNGNYLLISPESSTADVQVIGCPAATWTMPANFTSLSVDGSGLVNILQTAADKVWGTTTRALTDKAGFALSTAGILAVWDQLTSALTTANTIGKLLVDNINATISSRSSHAASAIWGVATRLLTAGTNIVLAKGVGVTGLNDLSAAQVNTEADTALTDIDLDHLSKTGAAPTPATGSNLDKIMNKDGSQTFSQTTDSLEAIKDTAGGDASAANQATMITHLTDIKGAGFAGSTDSNEAIRNRGDAAWATSGAGSGSVVVDQDYGGTDNLAYMAAGAYIDNVIIKVYLKTDYDAGNTGDGYIVAWTTTNIDGTWTPSELNLDPNTYTFYYFKQGFYGPDTQEVTVT